MILKRLYEYALDPSNGTPPKGMEQKEIAFAVVIDREGKFVRFESKRIDEKRCARFQVAKAVNRTSAPKTNTLWDNGKYVFGFEPSHARCNELFVARVKDLAANHPEDESIAALMRFYDTPAEIRLEAMSHDALFDDVKEALASNFSFRLEGDDCLIAEKTHLYSDFKDDSDREPVNARCLVTGEYGPIIRTATPTQLPGSSPMAALVSFQVNSGYDSYGKTQAYNAPISTDADELISAAIKKLKDKDSINKVKIGERMFLFWGTGDQDLNRQVEESMSGLLDFSNPKDKDADLNAKKVNKLFKGIYSGEIKTTLDDRFHILGLAPNVGRIAVVLWIECELRQFAERIFLHFSDMEIVDNRKPDSRRPYTGAYTMISAVTRGGKISDALPNLAESTVKAILEGSPYPFPLYTSALERIRAELTDLTVTVQRAAILKAYINRKNRYNKNHKPLQTMLDKTNDNPGYLCGRLVAVLEKIQKDAGNGESIRTRYMGSASSTPSTVFPAMLNVSIHHSEKLSEGSRIYYEQLKQEIIDKLPVSGFPAHLDLDSQGRFFVGYYHQRTELYTKKEK